MNMKILFIHGADATPDSFNFIEPHIDDRFDRTYLEYYSDNGFKNNLKMMLEQVSGDDDYFIVSHSLGGLYALYIADYLKHRMNGSVSISSPYNGSESASMLNMIKPCQLYRDISPYSEPIFSSQKIKIKCPWVQIVTTGGSSHWMNTDNDGVVTKKSMMHRSDMEFIEVDSGHYEIMMRYETINIINSKLRDITNE